MKPTHTLACAIALASMALAFAQKPAGKPAVNAAKIVEAVFAADSWTSESSVRSCSVNSPRFRRWKQVTSTSGKRPA